MMAAASLVLVCMMICMMVSVHGWRLPLPSYDVPSTVDLSSGGRSSVHGWLWLPQSQLNIYNVTHIKGYWSHHTPEFWMDSPHVFQIIVHGDLYLDRGVSGLPLPPYINMIGGEYTFTPPDDFSLNDLIRGQRDYSGNFWNGSFDTSYERKLLSTAKWNIDAFTTIHWLNETHADLIPDLPYLSYPQNPAARPVDILFLYFAHLIHSTPDFDHVATVIINFKTDCNWQGKPTAFDDVVAPGANWILKGIPNSVDHRMGISTQKKYQATLMSDTTSDGMICTATVIEQLHCVTGPDFADVCPPPKS